MDKIFNVFNSISTNVNLEKTFKIKNIKQLYEIIYIYWNVKQEQVKFDYNEYSKLYIVKLTNKFGETFAYIGDINFNPYVEY